MTKDFRVIDTYQFWDILQQPFAVEVLRVIPSGCSWACYYWRVIFPTLTITYQRPFSHIADLVRSAKREVDHACFYGWQPVDSAGYEFVWNEAES